MNEKERAEELLRSEERFRLAAHAGKMYAYEWDVASDAIIRSGDIQSVLGSTGEASLTRQQLLTGVHPDDRARFTASVTERTPENPDVQISYRLLRPDGSIEWVEKTAHAFFDADGRMIRMIGMVANITERKIAEAALRDVQQALRTSEERLRLAQQAAGIGAFERDVRTGRITWAEGLEPLYGLSPGSFDGKTPAFVQDFIHPADRQRVAQLIEKGLKTGQPTEGEWRAIWPDGSVHWIVSRWQVLMDDSGEPLRVVGVNLDITERKRAEEAVKESESRFRLVADAAPVLIWMSGLDKRPTYFNRAWLDFTGQSESDLQNGLAGIVHPDDYAKCHDIYCRGFDERQPFSKECRLRRHDGQYRWMLDIGVPRFHEDGSFAGYIGSCVDVTEQKLAEEARAKMSRRLIEVQDQERRLVARELHDDIIQRISVLACNLKSLEQNPPSSRATLQGRLREEYAQVSELASDIDALSRRLHSATLQRLGLAKAAEVFCREFSQREKLQLEFSTEGTLERIPDAISLCLHRVLQEALQNAAKHSGANRIDVRLLETSGEIHLIVSDSGRGFDLDSAMRGRGLGLTSMQERVRLVGGTIAIDSRPLAGTTVHVRAPVRSKRSAQKTEGDAP